MAISHTQPLVLFLLSLLILPAFGIKFRYCNGGQNSPVKVETVKLSPNPVQRSGNANITITGYTNKEILPEGVIVNLNVTLPGKTIYTKSYSLCDITACPVKPGPIVFTFTNVFTMEELRGWLYYVWINIVDEKHPYDQVMCVYFWCKIRGFTSMLYQATE